MTPFLPRLGPRLGPTSRMLDPLRALGRSIPRYFSSVTPVHRFGVASETAIAPPPPVLPEIFPNYPTGLGHKDPAAGAGTPRNRLAAVFDISHLRRDSAQNPWASR